MSFLRFFKPSYDLYTVREARDLGHSHARQGKDEAPAEFSENDGERFTAYQTGQYDYFQEQDLPTIPGE